ncbi:hypothetical protein HNR26_002614 [Rhizobium rosettiformans]|uniref:Uncharacterized protein n=2 Tax=Rhizobium rosettiformans TaxID=1368430 RepID=A0A4S8Q090_9HYPH|nr:hypothetical protein [Rhizobium rosettiformans]MBB5276545.1 hypothetical protein [Rhizobium rosettiformans]THV35845.1 hypothetical protein FAA86_10930 [Rhizobium rosettiformans W3]
MSARPGLDDDQSVSSATGRPKTRSFSETSPLASSLSGTHGDQKSRSDFPKRAQRRAKLGAKPENFDHPVKYSIRTTTSFCICSLLLIGTPIA